MPLNWWPFAKTRFVRCPDGSIKTVYKTFDDAFPLYIPGWQGEVAAQSEIQGMPAQMNAKYATQIHGLLVGLDELNRGVMFDFRIAYMAYVNDPCAHSGFFQREVEKMLDAQRLMRERRVKLQALVQLAQTYPNDSEAVFQGISRLFHELGRLDAPSAARAEIAETREDARRWIGGPDAC